MAFLEENCVLDILTDNILEECHPFVCGDDDMDEFFRKDAMDYTRYRMGKSYCFRMKDDVQTIVACFTVSYTKPPKDEVKRAERIKNPRKLKTRLMFCDLLDD